MEHCVNFHVWDKHWNTKQKTESAITRVSIEILIHPLQNRLCVFVCVRVEMHMKYWFKITIAETYIDPIKFHRITFGSLLHLPIAF